MFTFIPTVWSALMAVKYRTSLCYGVLTNDNWEGEIKGKGDSVKIFHPGDINIFDYIENTDMGDSQIPTHGDFMLQITQQKAFDFFIDRMSKLKDPNKALNAYMGEAVLAQREVMDTFFGSMYVHVHADNIITPSVAITKDNVRQVFTWMGRVMDERKIPAVGRKAVIPPLLKEVINLNMGDRETKLGDEATVNGYVGNFCGFSIHCTTSVPVVVEDINNDLTDEDVYKVQFGTDVGITKAVVVPAEDMEMYKPEKKFGNAFKGLCVYGGKMLYNGEKNFLLNAWFNPQGV